MTENNFSTETNVVLTKLTELGVPKELMEWLEDAIHLEKEYSWSIGYEACDNWLTGYEET